MYEEEAYVRADGQTYEPAAYFALRSEPARRVTKKGVRRKHIRAHGSVKLIRHAV